MVFSMEGGACVYSFKVEVVPDRDFTITAWSGSFALRVLYDVLHRRGMDFGKREAKPFVVEPPVVGGTYLLSGFCLDMGGWPHPKLGWRLVEAGKPLVFRYHFLDEAVAREFLRGLLEDPVLVEPACRLELAGVSFAQLGLPRPAGSGEEIIVRRVRFLTPTAFMFYGIDVLYPSPIRLMLSALRNYGRLTGVDTRAAAEGVVKTVEAVYSPRFRRVYVDLGEGRVVPAFMGEVTLALRGSRDLPLLLAALESAEVLGVGISRAVGFGRIKVEVGE